MLAERRGQITTAPFLSLDAGPTWPTCQQDANIRWSSVKPADSFATFTVRETSGDVRTGAFGHVRI